MKITILLIYEKISDTNNEELELGIMEDGKIIDSVKCVDYKSEETRIKLDEFRKRIKKYYDKLELIQDI